MPDAQTVRKVADNICRTGRGNETHPLLKCRKCQMSRIAQNFVDNSRM